MSSSKKVITRQPSETDLDAVASGSSFITSEMIKKNPILEVAGMFAGDPLFDELVKEIKKERERQKRRRI